MKPSIVVVTGNQLLNVIDDLARLRIEVFRDYPYLYEGTEEYEARYLETYVHSGDAMAVLALEGKQVVGASTGIPMAAESPAFKQPFIDAAINPETLFYCGESVLLPAYRGQGLYREFFQKREEYARAIGKMEDICFCGVVRPEDHPLKPQDYQPLDSVWEHFGYQPRPDLICQFPWKDIDCPESSDHAMMFWIKSLF